MQGEFKIATICLFTEYGIEKIPFDDIQEFKVELCESKEYSLINQDIDISFNMELSKEAKKFFEQQFLQCNIKYIKKILSEINKFNAREVFPYKIFNNVRPN